MVDGTPMPDEPGPDHERGQRVAPSWPLVAVSVVSAGVALIHVTFPDLQIDYITVGLLAVAALPWLAPVIKSLRFGDFQIELRDIKENIQDVQEQVTASADKVDALAEQVQQFTFSGPFQEEEQQSLTDALGGFYVHMRQLGLDVPPTEPVVDLVKPGPGGMGRMYYDTKKNRVVVSRNLLVDEPRILRSYATYLLTTTAVDAAGEPSPQVQVLCAGLAMYLPCSYRNDPVMGAASADVYNAQQSRPRKVEAYRIDDKNKLRIKKVPNSAPAGRRFHADDAHAIAWASAWWRVRGLVGAETLDPALVASWRILDDKPVASPPFRVYVEAVMDRVREATSPEVASSALQLIARSGLAEARTWAPT